MAVLTVQDIPAYGAGLEPTKTVAAAGGDSFPNDGNTFLLVWNGDAATHVVTATGIAGARTFGTAPAKAVTVDANNATNDGFAIYGPFEPSAFNDANGRVPVTYGDVHAKLTVAAVRFQRSPGA